MQESEWGDVEGLVVAGELAAGLAHDLGNLLFVIASHAEGLAERAPADDVKKDAQAIKAATDLATSLTRSLLAVGCRSQVQRELLDVNELVKRVARMATHVLGPTRTLTMHLDQSVSPIYIDVTEFERVILNLVVNAREAMPRGGHLVIETSLVDFAGDGAGRWRGRHAVIAVKDEGVGMNETTRRRLFQPRAFARSGGGHGLGLRIVRRIVEQCGGFLSVTSAPGQGSTFEVYLPVTTCATVNGEMPSTAGAARTDGAGVR